MRETIQLVSEHDHNLGYGVIRLHTDIIDDMVNGVDYEIHAEADMAGNVLYISMRKITEVDEEESTIDVYTVDQREPVFAINDSTVVYRNVVDPPIKTYWES